MVETYVPLIDQLGEIVKKHDKIVDELQQIVTSLRLENAELKKRLSRYESPNLVDTLTWTGKEYMAYVYIVADCSDGELHDAEAVPCEPGASSDDIFEKYRQRILVNYANPKIIGGGRFVKFYGHAFFSEEFHISEIKDASVNKVITEESVTKVINDAVEHAKHKLDQGIGL